MNNDQKLVIGVIVAIVIFAAVVLYTMPNRETIVSQPVPQEIKIVNQTIEKTIYVVVTPTPVPTRTVVPTRTPVPKYRPQRADSQIGSIFEVDFSRFNSGTSLEEMGLILGRENLRWRSTAQKEIVFNSLANFQKEKKKKVTSAEGVFEQFVYVQDGVVYSARNVSVPPGSVSILAEKGIIMYSGIIDGQEGKTFFVNLYREDVLVGTLMGENVHVTTIHIPGSDDTGSNSEGNEGENSSENSSGGESGEGDVPP